MTIEEAPVGDSLASLDALIERINVRVPSVGMIGLGFAGLMLVAASRVVVPNGRVYKK